MNAHLALALLALGPVRTGPATGPAAVLEPVPPATAAPPTQQAPDPIAFLAREWLKKR